MYIGKYRISLGRPDIPCRTSPERLVEIIVLYGNDIPNRKHLPLELNTQVKGFYYENKDVN